MKNVIIFLLISLSASAQVSRGLVICDNITEMKTKPIDTKSKYLVINAMAPEDNRGGLYYFDSLSTAAEDMVYYNIIAPTSGGVGRYKRANTRNINLTQGQLDINGGIKTLQVSGTLNASGEASFNLTYDNTTTGTWIFTTQPKVFCSVRAAGQTGNNVIVGQPKVFTNGGKTVTVSYSRGNEGVVGLLFGLRSAPAGTVVDVMITGM